MGKSGRALSTLDPRKSYLLHVRHYLRCFLMVAHLNLTATQGGDNNSNNNSYLLLRTCYWLQDPFRISLTILLGVVVSFLLRKKLRKAKWLHQDPSEQACWGTRICNPDPGGLEISASFMTSEKIAAKCFPSWQSALALFPLLSVTYVHHESHLLQSQGCLCSVSICYICWKRNVDLLSLKHVDRTPPGEYSSDCRRWNSSSSVPIPLQTFPLPSSHDNLWFATSPIRGNYQRGSVSISDGLLSQVPKYVCVCVCACAWTHVSAWLLCESLNEGWVWPKISSMDITAVFDLLMKPGDESGAVHEWRGSSGHSIFLGIAVLWARKMSHLWSGRKWASVATQVPQKRQIFSYYLPPNPLSSTFKLHCLLPKFVLFFLNTSALGDYFLLQVSVITWLSQGNEMWAEVISVTFGSSPSEGKLFFLDVVLFSFLESGRLMC